MTKTMIPPDPQPGDDQPNRWFASGRLDGAEPVQPVVQLPCGPRLVASPSDPPLPKRAGVPGGRHRAGQPMRQSSNVSLTQPTAADLAALSTVVDELNGALSQEVADRVDAELVRKSAAVDDAVRPELAATAARRIAKGHLSYSERESIAAVLSAYATVPTSTVLPVALLASLESAVAVLSASRVDQQLGADTDTPATPAGTDGAL